MKRRSEAAVQCLVLLAILGNERSSCAALGTLSVRGRIGIGGTAGPQSRHSRRHSRSSSRSTWGGIRTRPPSFGSDGRRGHRGTGVSVRFGRTGDGGGEGNGSGRRRRDWGGGGGGGGRSREGIGTEFEWMKGVDGRLAKLERTSPDVLMSFYEPQLLSFSVRPGSVERLSVTSTCFALEAILSASDPSLFAPRVNFDLVHGGNSTSPSDGRVPLRAMIQALLSTEWRPDDLFQIPVLLYTILSVDAGRALLSPSMTEQLAVKVRQLVAAVINTRPRRRFGQSQQLSDYLIFLGAKAMVALEDATSSDASANKKVGIGGLPMVALPDEGTPSELSIGLERCVEASFNELCRQLAYRACDDYGKFDVVRLAYSLLTYVSASTSLASSGSAGREVVPGAGPLEGTTVTMPNRKLVNAGLDAFFAEQNSDGMWPKGQPIYKSFRKSGRNVGNAFVFSLDTLGNLMGLLPAEAFRPHMDALERSLSWIENHQTLEVIADYCDPETGQCYGKTLRGWSSPHLNQEAAQAWSTAQALTCVSRMRKVIRRLMNDDVLYEFGGVVKDEDEVGRRPESWDRLLDSDLGNCGTGKCRTIKEVLDERIIVPFTPLASTTGAKERVGSPYPGPGAAYSCILFGAPGTAKTTICEAVADYMGWNFLVIDTSAFLADGLTNVASRIRYVFERLQALDRCVILFDEIEEFCLDRENPSLGMESRMLTTAMLTAINDLRRAKRSIFFLATNRLKAFDSAITRPGRFDMQLFVGTPNLEARCIQFQQQLAPLPLSDAVRAEAEHRYRFYLESVWTEDAMFMNYLEGLQFAASCADLVASSQGGSIDLILTDEAMALILKSQVPVMTVRGPVRQDYVASMELSRL